MSDIGVGLILFVGVLLLVAVIRFLAWLTELQNEHGSLGRAGLNTVKKYVGPRPSVMSRWEEKGMVDRPSSLETQKQTDGQTEPQPRIKAEELLTLCKTMRAAGISREDAAAAFKASGLPFNNNVWAKAAPVNLAGNYVTPIVGRATNAQFETDRDFPYQAPA